MPQAADTMHMHYATWIVRLQLLLAVASSATAAAALFIVSYSFMLVFVFRQSIFPLYFYRAGSLLWNAEADFSLSVNNNDF